MPKYQLENTENPNLFEEYFDYARVPLIVFEDQTVPLNRPDAIWITDTTFRDGQQARPPYDTEQIVHLYDLLHKLGGPRGVIRQSEFFLYSDKDKLAVTKCLELGHEYPQVTGWIRAVKSDFRLVKELGLKETGILTSASDYHIFLKLKMNRQEALDKYMEIVDAALESGIVPRCHFEDITRADFPGFILPFARKLMERSRQAAIPVKIRACDTLGFGLPYPQATLPRSVPKIFHALSREAGVPSEYLEWHGHNDFHKVLINGTTAWLYNCAAVNGTLLGWGERTGNPPIEGLIMDYIALNGGDPEALGIDTRYITEIARYYHDVIGDQIMANYPFVGEDFNTTRAGIHADGAIKDERIYNIFDTGKLLDRPLSVAITDKSGVAGVALWINSYFKLSPERRVSKTDPAVNGIHEWVEEEYKNNRVSSVSAAEMVTQAKKHLPHLFHSDLEGLKRKGKRLAIDIINTILEKHPAVATMKPEAIKPVLTKFMKHDAYAKLIYMVDEKGNMVSDYISQPDDMVKYQAKLLDKNFADRQWFQQAMVSDSAYVSDFYISKVVGELCITVARSIKDKQGRVLGVLGIDINFDNLIKLS